MENLPTSFSEIVDHVQSDKQVGKELLISLITAYNDCGAEIKDLEDKLSNAKSSQGCYYSGVQRTITHLQLRMPLGVSFDNGLFVVTENGITFEANII